MRRENTSQPNVQEVGRKGGVVTNARNTPPGRPANKYVPIPDDRFEATMARVLEEDHELLRRLA